MKNQSKFRLLAVILLLVGIGMGFTSCKDRNTPSGGGSSSYSGYTPTAEGMVGRWLDLGVLMKFRWNGSTWDVEPSDMSTFFQDKDLQVTSGNINYSRVDDYTALLEFNLEYSYTYRTSRETNTFRGSNIVLNFSSSVGGTWSGMIGGSPYVDRIFRLSN